MMRRDMVKVTLCPANNKVKSISKGKKADLSRTSERNAGIPTSQKHKNTLESLKI